MTHVHRQSGWRVLMITLNSPGDTTLGTNKAGLVVVSCQLLPTACVAGEGSGWFQPGGGGSH